MTGKYLPGQPPPEASRAAHREAGADCATRLDDDLLTRVQRLKPIADQVGLTLAQLAVAWVLANPAVSSAIIGASRPDQVSENVKAAGAAPVGRRAGEDRRHRRTVVERDPGQTKSPANRNFS